MNTRTHEWVACYDTVAMTSRYSFIETCQKVAQSELGSEAEKHAVDKHSAGENAPREKRRDKLLSMLGGLLPARSTSSAHDEARNSGGGVAAVPDKRGDARPAFCVA